jgi:hypothetical protein
MFNKLFNFLPCASDPSRMFQITTIKVRTLIHLDCDMFRLIRDRHQSENYMSFKEKKKAHISLCSICIIKKSAHVFEDVSCDFSTRTLV